MEYAYYLSSIIIYYIIKVLYVSEWSAYLVRDGGWGGWDWWSGHHWQMIGWSSYHPTLIFPQWSTEIALKPVFCSQILGGGGLGGWVWKRCSGKERKLNAGDLDADPALKVAKQAALTHLARFDFNYTYLRNYPPPEQFILQGWSMLKEITCQIDFWKW